MGLTTSTSVSSLLCFSWEFCQIARKKFLYPIYPLVCVAASAVIESFTDLFRDKYNPYDNSIIVMMAKFLRPVALSLILCASHSHTFSLINGYAAPMEVYKILEHHDDAGTGDRDSV
ncbi:dol-P-Man:Man(6)GlcNAc(2)-PP-Dol alpha-1,2-mannosyltransferase-like isoform X4 [Gossypium arboreum]|uniref:dol-P-Man:Man(6)GlcNAc(2)-PP-Dol alpha-1,2-mannosyltransferase-like isoform X4 n=1 Tax=Gossypium arboreum TaxID=29729 RepID=UPI0022F1959F|nr:dol-P-Man:Man(6)GlcNAc(2)-PP-Dol alpha-1,2-mannosyltransferase-like isoform X4 [Gossypium arboreum]